MSNLELRSLKCLGGSLRVVDRFHYLGDVVSGGGGCSENIVAIVRIGWKKFRKLLLLLAIKVFSFSTKSRLLACIRTAKLYGGETWALNAKNLKRLKCKQSTNLLREKLRIRDVVCKNDCC